MADHFDLYVKGAGLPILSLHKWDDAVYSWTIELDNEQLQFLSVDLLTPRGALSNTLKSQIYDTLKEKHSISIEALASQLNIKESEAAAGLNMMVQAGRAMFDMDSEQYQLRELFAADMDLSALQFSSPEEEQAIAFLQRGMSPTSHNIKPLSSWNNEKKHHKHNTLLNTLHSLENTVWS